MLSLSQSLSPHLWSLAAILARVGGFAALVPLLTTHSGVLKYRVALAIVLALVVVPTAPAPSTPADGRPEHFGLVLSELAAGLLFGFALRVVFTGIALAAQLIEQQMGLPCSAEDADESPASPIGRLYQLAALAVFFTLGGHRLVIDGLLDFSAADLLGGGNNLKALDGTVTLLAQACWLSARVAAPAALALLIANLTTAMIARVIPQFSGTAVTVPVQLALGVLAILCSLSIVGSQFADGFIRFMNLISRALVDG